MATAIDLILKIGRFFKLALHVLKINEIETTPSLKKTYLFEFLIKNRKGLNHILPNYLKELDKN
jgi:hypothetical protein